MLLSRGYCGLRAMNRSYGLAVFGIYLLLFVVTLSLVFVFPPGALLMVFLGLAGLLVAVIGAKLLRLAQIGAARLIRGRGICPACGARDQAARAGATWSCTACGTRFSGGSEVEEQGGKAGT